jgi:hypothetical protein
LSEDAETTGGRPLPASDPVAIRDHLLDLIVTKLEARRETRPLALRIVKLLDRLRGNEALYRGDDDLVASAMAGPLERLQRWTGRDKLPTLRVWRMDLDLVTLRMQAFQREQPHATRGAWTTVIKGLWRSPLNQARPLRPMALDEVLGETNLKTAALKLVYHAHAKPDSDLDHFRRALARVRITPLV